jgi:hypothetical protein
MKLSSDTVEYVKDLLVILPEPIMVTGHVGPDADVISSAAALLNRLEDTGRDCYFSYRGNMPKAMRWCIPDKFIRKDDLTSYKSLIVVDCDGSELRLGFEPRKVPTLILDHHLTSMGLSDGKKYFVVDAPSTSSILLNFGIYDPIIYVGLFYDSLAINKRVIEAAQVIVELSKHGLTDEVIGQYHALLDVKKDPELIDAFRNSYVDSIEFDTGGVLGLVVSEGPEEYKHDLAAYFRQYFDGLFLFMKKSNTISIRLEEKFPFKANEFAQKYGGGGHKGAAGLLMPENMTYGILYREFIDWMRAQESVIS